METIGEFALPSTEAIEKNNNPNYSIWLWIVLITFLIFIILIVCLIAYYRGRISGMKSLQNSSLL